MRLFYPGIRPVALLLVIAAAVLLAGCETRAAADPGTGASPPPGTAQPDDGNPRPPEGAIEIDGAVYPLGLGSYCWSGPADEDDELDRLAVCADAIGIITASPYAVAAPGATLTITGDLAALDFEVRYAHLWPLPESPVATGDLPVAWEAWQPPEVEPHVLAANRHALVLPADLDPGSYLLSLDIASGDSSASYGAVIEIP